MSDYEQQYYIVRAAEGRQVPYLGPDENTSEKNFSFEPQPLGAPPLVFTNMQKERNRTEGVKEAVGSILFHANNLVVCTSIRDALLDLHVAGMFMHPSIYIDDQDNWHEDYWYVTFTELFDCWDRTLSDKSTTFLETDGQKSYDVYEYLFNQEIMDKTPLKQRLLFKMGGTLEAFVFCHESIASIFRRNTPNGARLVLAADY